MLFPGFIERKELEKINSNLKRLKEERRIIESKIKEEELKREKAEYKLDMIINPIKHLEKERADQNYTVLYKNEYYNGGKFL